MLRVLIIVIIMLSALTQLAAIAVPVQLVRPISNTIYAKAGVTDDRFS